MIEDLKFALSRLRNSCSGVMDATSVREVK
jgi:hypothetical protein